MGSLCPLHWKAEECLSLEMWTAPLGQVPGRMPPPPGDLCGLGGAGEGSLPNCHDSGSFPFLFFKSYHAGLYYLFILVLPCSKWFLVPQPGIKLMPPCILTSGLPGRYPWTRFLFVLLAQSCLTLCNPMDCSLPGSSLHGILQA